MSARDIQDARLDTDLRAAIESLPPFASIPQVVSLGVCSDKTLRRGIASGKLAAVKVGVRRPGTLRDTRHIRITRESLAGFLSPVTGGAR